MALSRLPGTGSNPPDSSPPPPSPPNPKGRMGRTVLKEGAKVASLKKRRSSASLPPGSSASLPPSWLSTQAEPSQGRLVIVWGVLLLSSVALGLHLFRLQVFQAKTLTERAQEQQVSFLRPFVPRRPIVDRNGDILALDQPAYVLYAHPKLFSQPPEEVAAQIAPLLDQSASVLMKKFSEGDTGLKISIDLSESVAHQIQKLHIDGIDLEQQQLRFYPQQDLFAGIVGYVNVDRQGQAGIEFSQQNVLERSAQAVRLRRMGDGSILPAELPEGFLHLDNLRLQLTLDSRIQRIARQALKKQMEQFQAKRGAVIVMDARDGALLSLVTEPSFNPNLYYKTDLSLLKNWALTDLYEPGSTLKPINVAIALESGSIQPDTTLPDEGTIYVDGWPISNHDNQGHGSLRISEIIKYSSNVGMVHMIDRIKPGVYYDWLERVGMGKISGIDLPFEVAGQIRPRQDYLDARINRAVTSFGQGVSLNPMQLVRLHGLLASGGKLLTPYVVRGLFDADGKQVWQPQRPASTQVFSPQTAQAVVQMMETVVADGTGKVAQIPGYRIAGKTGTAQKAGANGGYLSNTYITSFVSILPAEAPRYVVAVVVDEPKGGQVFGSTVAAPAAKTIMEGLITIEGIPPSPKAPASSG